MARCAVCGCKASPRTRQAARMCGHCKDVCIGLAQSSKQARVPSGAHYWQKTTNKFPCLVFGFGLCARGGGKVGTPWQVQAPLLQLQPYLLSAYQRPARSPRASLQATSFNGCPTTSSSAHLISWDVSLPALYITSQPLSEAPSQIQYSIHLSSTPYTIRVRGSNALTR